MSWAAFLLFPTETILTNRIQSLSSCESNRIEFASISWLHSSFRSYFKYSRGRGRIDNKRRSVNYLRLSCLLFFPVVSLCYSLLCLCYLRYQYSKRYWYYTILYFCFVLFCTCCTYQSLLCDRLIMHGKKLSYRTPSTVAVGYYFLGPDRRVLYYLPWEG